MTFEVIESAGAPIKAWTRGVQLEDQAKQQLQNLASMPFIFRHVAAMPDVHWGMGATVGSVIATKGAIIPAAVGVDIGCFRGDTRIPLLDGTQATLEDLARRSEPFWIYSVGPGLRIVPGRARALRTRRDAELMRVVVSGGDEVFCTPDHRFMLSDGSFKEARDLRFNESLMPLYRTWQTRDGYESVSNGKGRAALTHELVWEALHGELPEGRVIHHDNHNHFDNRPDNLVMMSADEHSRHHRMTGHRLNNANPALQAKRLAGVAARSADPGERQKMATVGSANIRRYMTERPEEFRAAVAGNGKRGAPYLRDFNVSPRACSDCDVVAKNPSALRWHRQREHGTNHKVISATVLSERADVYCLQVEEHHNFALAAGVFVHNCGMAAQRTTLVASDLPDSLAALRSAIERRIPHGRTNNGRHGDRGSWGEIPPANVHLVSPLVESLAAITARHPKLERAAGRAPLHAGTLGTGNHFVEVCLDEEQRVWIMLHSGSRGIGNAIGQYFIEAAKKEMERSFVHLPDKDLAYLPQESPLFDEYFEAVGWAQGYARINRTLMMKAALLALAEGVPKPFTCDESAVQCHHNYVQIERHFGEDVMVTRKGAVDAHAGALGIIPGSMGARSFIVRGKGNPESFSSCSHGAGRKMSRGEAKRTFTIADHEAATAGVECRKDADVIDETPGAYKDIDAVMAAQDDLVEVVHTLKQVVCVKG